MDKVFEAIINSPFFACVLSILAFKIGAMIQKAAKGSPLLNPLLLGIIIVVAVLRVLNISYETYLIGGKFISFFIAPATVAMVVNLYKNFKRLTDNLVPVLVGVLVGSVTSILTAYLLSKAFGFDEKMTLTMLPKSLTTAIGVSISAEYGGYPDITTISIVLTGVTGAVVAPIVMKVFNVKDPVARGVGIGTSTHAVGTSKAIEMGEVEGAMSGLSIALAGFITVIVMPLLISILP